MAKRDTSKFKKYSNEYTPSFVEYMDKKQKDLEGMADEFLAELEKKKPEKKGKRTKPAKGSVQTIPKKNPQMHASKNTPSSAGKQSTMSVAKQNTAPPQPKLERKEVHLYVRGSTDDWDPNKAGRYVALLQYKGKTEAVYGEDINTTANGMQLTAAIEAIALLKMPCHLILHSHSPIGGAMLMKNKISGPNSELLLKLRRSLIAGKHECEFVVSTDKQNELASLIRKHFKKTVFIPSEYGDLKNN